MQTNLEDRGKMNEATTPSRPSREAAFELAAFLVTSARGCIDEPRLYGPFRLLDALTRFVEISRSVGTSDPFLDQVKEKIDENIEAVSSDRDRFKSFLDTLVRDFARELKTRNSSDSAT